MTVNKPLRIDCKNPHDIRPVVDTFKNRMQQPSTSNNLVVISGENHKNPGSKLLQIAFMKACLELGIKPAYAAEVEYNRSLEMASIYGVRSKSPLLAKLLEADPLGHNILKAFIREYGLRISPVTMKAIFKFCIKSSIPVGLVDAAKCDGNIFRQDPYTGNIAKQHNSEYMSMNIPNTSRLGIAIRNQVMVEKSIELLRRTQRDLVLLGVGEGHVFGSRSMDALYPESIAQQFKSRGFDVLPIIATADNRNHATNDLPDEADLNNSIIASNLGVERDFGEWHEINKTLRGSSFEIPFSPYSLADRIRWKGDVRKFFQKMCRDDPELSQTLIRQLSNFGQDTTMRLFGPKTH